MVGMASVPVHLHAPSRGRTLHHPERLHDLLLRLRTEGRAVKHLTITIDGTVAFDEEVADVLLLHAPDWRDLISSGEGDDYRPKVVGRLHGGTTTLTIQHGPHVQKVDPPEPLNG
jgi:hypothetical protein